MPVKGSHAAVADGVFAQLMEELGIERPDMPPTMDALKIDWFKFLSGFDGKERKGTSTLKKWTCPECGMNVRMGISGNPELIHHPCSEKLGEKVFLVRDDGLKHTIYEIGGDKSGKGN